MSQLNSEIEFFHELVDSAKVATSLPAVMHRLNNSAMSALSALNWIEPKSGEIQPEMLSGIQAESSRAIRFCRKLSSAVKIQRRSIHQVNLNHAMEMALQTIPRRHETVGEILVDLPDPAIQYRGSEIDLTLAVVHLLDNAIESSNDLTQKIRLTLAKFENSVRISVADEGRGMDAALVATCIEPLVTTKSMQQGLGLTATSIIVENHLGSMTIKSTVDQGTMVEILLPIRFG